MADIKDCPGFETFGADLKAARKQLGYSREALAEMAHISRLYLTNIENDQKIPSLHVIIRLVRVCGLPTDKYFDLPADKKSETASEQRQRVSKKVDLCPETYLSIIEGALDGAIKHT